MVGRRAKKLNTVDNPHEDVDVSEDLIYFMTVTNFPSEGREGDYPKRFTVSTLVFDTDHSVAIWQLNDLNLNYRLKIIKAPSNGNNQKRT